MILGHPVTGAIHPTTWKRPRGNTDWRVTQPFGCTGVDGEPRLGTCRHFHRGIDLGYGGCGRAVLAAAAGKVVFSGVLGNGEKVVVIRHADGWATSYGHLATRTVAAGITVATGQRVGTCGESGFAAGCHLHFAAKSGLTARVSVADFIPDPFGGRGDSTGKWQDPWPRLEVNAPAAREDTPRAPAAPDTPDVPETPAITEEEVVYPFKAYIPGSSVSVLENTNVRRIPSVDDAAILRTTAAAEAWIVTGFVQGADSMGSDWWLQRWAIDHYEYAHKSQTGDVVEPAGDCSDEIAAALALQEETTGGSAPGVDEVIATSVPSRPLRRRPAHRR